MFSPHIWGSPHPLKAPGLPALGALLAVPFIQGSAVSPPACTRRGTRPSPPSCDPWPSVLLSSRLSLMTPWCLSRVTWG